MNRVLKIRVLKRLFCDFCPQLPGSNLRLDPKAVDVRNWPWGPRCLSKKFLESFKRSLAPFDRCSCSLETQIAAERRECTCPKRCRGTTAHRHTKLRRQD